MHASRLPGESGSPPGAGPGWHNYGNRMGLCHRFVYNCCSSISSCLYFVCCCWLIQDCLRGPRDALGPAPPPPPIPHGPGLVGPSAAPYDLPGPPGPPGLLERRLL